MKKIVCIIMMIVLLTTTAYADEITFRGIPWGSSIDEIEEMLDAGNLYAYNDCQMRRWKNIEQQFDWEHLYDFSCGWNGCSFPEDFKVAGYDVSKIDVYCAWGLSDEGEILRDKDESVLYIGSYMFSVVDPEAVYIDLRGKLSSLYGEPVETMDKNDKYYAGVADSGEYEYTERIATWDGDNNTAVRLYCYTSDLENDLDAGVAVYYGKTDMDYYIDKLQACLREEALREEQESRTDSTDGL